MKVVKRFADSLIVYENGRPSKSQNMIHWVEYTDGTKENITEDETQDIWLDWVMRENVSKKEENGFLVFEYNDR